VSVVLDASMTIAWLFRDERTELPQALLRSVAVEGALVPAIWRLEVAAERVRCGRCDEGYATRSLARLGRLRIAVDSETDRYAWGATRELSRRHDLTVYDAAYLELAARSRQPLASADAAMLRAAREVGVEVLGD